MKYTNLLFDLDGTITDSREGILNSLYYAFEKIGVETPSQEVLRSFLGPPVEDSFRNTFDLTEEEVAEGVKYFRERYTTLGLYENRVYEGMDALLKRLASNKNLRVFVATAKPEPSAVRILEYFKLDTCFEKICGSTFNGSIKNKAQVIEYLLESVDGDFNEENTLMIGDRNHDVLGAIENSLPCAGILYGYGDREELEAAGAKYIIDSVSQLEAFLLGSK